MSGNERQTQMDQSPTPTRTSQAQPPSSTRGTIQEFNPIEFMTNPFAAMRRMHDEMDRFFASAFGQQTGSAAMGGLGTWSPTVEISEKPDQLTVCAELPGLKPEDVKVEVTDDALIIQGERKHESKQEDGGRWRSERHYGRFYRAVPLPEGATADQARADFKNGELRVTVPVKQPETNRRQIPISDASGQPQQVK